MMQGSLIPYNDDSFFVKTRIRYNQNLPLPNTSGMASGRENKDNFGKNVRFLV
jgi:hypothetical protein